MPLSLPIYLDNQATTPCDPRVIEAMLPYFGERFGNAASKSHSFGFFAKAAVDKAREQVAASIGAKAREIVWTSGATESNNLAVLGAARAARERGRHVITTSIEHKAVLDPCAQLVREGFEVTVLPVDGQGRVSPADLVAALRPDTIVVSVMWANNEIGTVQPIAELGALCRERGVLLHTDAAQAAGKLPIDVGAASMDLLSLSAHKVYGPKGIGALFVRSGRPRVRLEPLVHGGGHERGLRSGTLPVPLIVGMGLALSLGAAEVSTGALDDLAALRDHLWSGLDGALDGVERNGSATHCLPGNLNLCFRGTDAEALLMGLRDIACSSGSACTSATLEPSHVLGAIGADEERLQASVRFGLGRFTTRDEIDHAVTRVSEEVGRLRAMRPTP